MEPLTIATTKWTFTQKIIFRFFFVYFVLYCFPFPLDAFEFTMSVAAPFYHFLDWLIPLMGKYVFNINASLIAPFEKTPDSSYGLVYMFSFFLLSFLLSLIWTTLDRKRCNYKRLDQWFRLYLRLYLALMMLYYGFMKVYPLQRIPISEFWLDLPYGMQQRRAVVWHFLGYSENFTRFIGWGEVIGGTLLLWHRTLTLGALISTGILSTVVALNFCYGIPVKFFSSHLLIIAIILLLKDRKRLLNLLVLNKATEPVVYSSILKKPLWQNALLILLLVLIGCMYYKLAGERRQEYNEALTRHRPLNGIYHTVYFVRGNDTIPPLQTDSLRWKKLVVDQAFISNHVPVSAVYLSTDSLVYCKAIVDTFLHEMRLHFTANGDWVDMDFKDSCRMAYSLPDVDHLLLRGIWKNDSIRIMMKKYDLNNYPLYREKFQWIYD